MTVTAGGRTYPTPTPLTILTALRDHGLNPVLWPGWQDRGRTWQFGLRALVDHHTSGVGSGVVEWCHNTSGRYPYVNAFVGRDGRYHLLGALSCWGSGAGGPWPGVAAKDSLHLVAWQTEVESWGSVKDFTGAQFEALGRGNAALVDLGVPAEHEVNHRGWTDGGPELGLTYWFPTRGRKPDTLYDVHQLRLNTGRYVRPRRKTVPVGGRTPLWHTDAARQLGMSLVRWTTFNGNLPDPMPAGTIVTVPADFAVPAGGIYAGPRRP